MALIFESKTLIKQFDNSPTGFKLLAVWLKSLRISQVQACLEATGTYGDAVATFLHEAGHFVSVVNPSRIKGYALSKLQRNKTDTADARLIADFCRTQNPAQWFPPTPQVAIITSLNPAD